jgi:hypothetical protein
MGLMKYFHLFFANYKSIAFDFGEKIIQVTARNIFLSERAII